MLKQGFSESLHERTRNFSLLVSLKFCITFIFIMSENYTINYQNILRRIRGGESVRPLELLPFLMAERRNERSRINADLARAYSEAGNFAQAKIFISRALNLSDFSKDLLDLYIEIHASLRDIESLRSIYKLLGLKACREGNINEALNCFNKWQYAYASHLKMDRFEADPEILRSVQALAEPIKFKHYYNGRRGNGKLRIAYLIYGMTHHNSVLVKINRMFARYHDKQNFDVSFFIPDRRKLVLSMKEARQTVRYFMDNNCGVSIASHSISRLKRIKSIAKRIYDFQPDVLITSALLADFEHYFIASLRPAPVTIGLIQGPPDQFAAPDLDWAISWSKHPLIDAPCDCSLVKLGINLPERSLSRTANRSNFNINESCIVAMSVGRYVKFQDIGFWAAIIELLHSVDNLCYVVVGANREEIPVLNNLLHGEIESRIKLLGWRSDCLEIMQMADIIIDTYPSGGGHVLVDAMALGIPFVSFENDYMQKYDQTNWSVADEFTQITELIVPRSDFKQFNRLVSKLITDHEYRIDMGQLCKDSITTTMKDQESSVRDFEQIIREVISQKKQAGSLFRSELKSFVDWFMFGRIRKT